LSKGHLSILSIEWCGAIHPRRYRGKGVCPAGVPVKTLF
jgi:hypothetical protein